MKRIPPGRSRGRVLRLIVITLLSFAGAFVLLNLGVAARRAASPPNSPTNLSLSNRSNTKEQQPLAPDAAVITATITDNVAVATKVAPGATINYTAIINNGGAASPADDATNLNFSAPLDANTTLVAGSVHASPVAFNDTYNWVGNTFLDTSARALPAVTANDVAVNPPGGTDTFTLTAIAGGATALGGTVTLASPSGAFTYTPPLGRPNLADGATVQDSFTYTITNNADPSLTGIGTVRINLNGRVWYLQAGAAGDGRSNTPSSSPTAMSTAADKSTDVFYIFSNAAALNGPFSIDAGQQLLGQGVNLVVSAITLFNAAAPTPTTTNTAGNCVALAGAPGNNTLSGFNIGNCTGGIAITGANVGALNVSTLSINTNGGGLNLTGVATPSVSIVLGGLTSSSGTNNVRLVSLNGTITLASGTLSGATGNGFDVSGGAATITYLGNITNSGAKQVNIANMTGGSATFDGAVNGTGTGINLATNPGATFTFRGGVVLSTTTNTAFGATGGGTVAVCDENPCNPAATGALVNTLTTTTGTALNVANTNISLNHLEFRTINAGTAALSPTNGIILNTTGTSASFGGLKIKGTGGAGTGGTIQRATGAGVMLTSTRDVSFVTVVIQNGTDDGITGLNVTNFTLTNSTISANGNATLERGLDMTNLLGSSSITGSSITGNAEDNLYVKNGTGTSTLTVTTTTISNTSATVGNDGIHFLAADVSGSNNANMSITVTNCTFTNHRGDHFQGLTDAATSASQTIIFQNNSLTGDGGATIPSGNPPGSQCPSPPGTGPCGNDLGAGITLNPSGTANVSFNISNNGQSSGTPTNLPWTGAVVSAITINSSSNSTMSGTIHNNVIGNAAVLDSGSSQGNGIAVTANNTSDITVAITNNQIRQYSNLAGINISVVSGASDTINATITGNTISNPGTFASHGILAQAGAGAGDAGILCLDIGGAGALANSIAGSGANGSTDFRVRQRFSTTVRLPGYGGANNNDAAVVTFIQGRNTGAETGSATNNVAAGGVGFVGGAACASPALGPQLGRGGETPRSDSLSDGPMSAFTLVQGGLTRQAIQEESLSEVAWTQAIIQTVNSFALAANQIPSTSKKKTDAGRSHHAVRHSLKPAGQDPNAPSAGEIVSLNAIATLPATKSITIKYAATVNTTALTARQASTRGTVTFTGGLGSPLLTDDPEIGGTQATVTLLDTTLTWIGTGTTPTDWNDPTNWTRPGPVVSSYAPGVSNPGVNDVVIPNVGAQPAITATDINVFSLNLASGRTLTIDPARSLTINGAAAGSDLTLNGIIAGGTLSFAGAGPHVINNAGGTGSLSSSNAITLLSPAAVTLNNNLQAGGITGSAGATFNLTNRTLSLNGTGLAGTGVFTTTGSTVIFNGAAAQTAAGITYNNLTINNTAIGAPNALGVTLLGNATVNGVLALTSNDLNTGGFTLTQPNTTASTGVSDVVGTVIRTGGPFGLISLTFGNPNNIITFTGAGTRPTTMTVVLAKAAPATHTGAVQRNYTISQTGGSLFTATVRLHYLDSELNGNTPETSLGLRRLRTSDSHWVAAPPPPGVPTRDGTANWIEATSVLAADLTTQWTFSVLAPTAANGSITGRILDDNGNAVEGAVVRLEGAQNRKFITDANGVYRFDQVETGGFYTVTPSRVNYNFSPASRSFSQTGATTDAVFGATLATSGNFLNPLDTPEYFVRQHYLDFLGREPDEAGFNFWSDQILECGLAGNIDQSCIERRRENVSAAYFLSIEFQKTGGLVDGLYRASYGVRPAFADFMPDTRMVGDGVRVGFDGWEAKLEANKEAFVAAFVNRPAFQAAFAGLDNTAFVDTLISHTGIVFTSSERDAFVSGLGTGTMNRADVLRSIAEDNRFVAAKFNETFVMMEYFGYLRRDADSQGFTFWLTKLNEFNGNFEQAEMVEAFIVSGEYRDRFPR